MKVEELNIGVKINCDIANLSEQDYNDINELYLKHLIIVFENQPYQTFVELSEFLVDSALGFYRG